MYTFLPPCSHRNTVGTVSSSAALGISISKVSRIIVWTETAVPVLPSRCCVPTLWMQGRAGWVCRPTCTVSRPRLSCRSSRRRYLLCPARSTKTRTVAGESACSRRGHCRTAWSPHVPTPSHRNLQSLVRYVDCPSCRGCEQLTLCTIPLVVNSGQTVYWGCHRRGEARR